MDLNVVLFDLDGTLTDSAAGIMSSYRHALRLLGLDAPDEAIRACIGPPLVDGFAALGVPARRLDEAVDLYRRHFSEVGILENQLYPGVAEMLDALSGAGLRLALATSKLGEYGGRILDQFGISGHFEAISGATRDGSRLHKEEIVDHALAELGRPDPAGVVMVGDREHDMLAARRHGLRGIGVTWGYGSVDELLEAFADVLAETPRQVVELVLAGG